MRLNLKKLGCGMLAAGPLMKDLIPVAGFWWIGLVFAAFGAVLMAVEQPKNDFGKPIDDQ